jgi:spermidine synthase
VEYVEVARAETERGEVVLRERREEGAPTVLELRVNGVFVMDTLETSSERALAHEALALVADPRQVLVGGLGLGFTAHEVLADHRVEQCTVVELEEPLVRWMRDGTVPHGPRVLADERLTVTVGDVAQVLEESGPQTWDLVLLDVDNGPGYLVHDANAALYDAPFLEVARRAARGALVVWSAAEAPDLEAAMRAVLGNAEARPYDVLLGEREETYWLYVSQVTGGSRSERSEPHRRPPSR